MPKARELQQVHTLPLEELTRLIDQLWGKGIDGTGGEYSRYREQLKAMRDMFFNLPAADPPSMDSDKASLDTGERYQSDILRQTADKLIARIAENMLEVRCNPASDSQADRELADDQEKIANEAIQLSQKRFARGTTFQALLADGQVRQKGAWLHWQADYDLWPTQDYKYAETGGDAYSPDAEEDGDNKGKYRETDDSALARHNREKASRGWPWRVEIPHPAEIAAIPDDTENGPENGLGVIVRVRNVQIVNLADQLRKDGYYLTLQDNERKLGVSAQMDAPPAGWDTERAQTYGKECRLASVWTETECYELVAYGGGKWELLKSWKHPYKMPPFVHIPARVRGEAEPHLRYEGEMTGLYRTKPFYDRNRTYADQIMEGTALPVVWFETDAGSVWVPPDGSPGLLDFYSAMKVQLPEGVRRKVWQPTTGAGLMQTLEMSKQDMSDAMPQMGAAEAVTGTTPPGNVYAQQAEANRGPKQLMAAQARGFEIMLRNMFGVHKLPADEGGFGEEITLYVYDGTKAKMLTLKPADIVTDNITVTINERSEANTVTKQQLDLILHEKGFLTDADFVEDSMNKANAVEHMDSIYKHRIFLGALGRLEQVVAARLGLQFVFGADEQKYDLNGQPVADGVVAQRNMPPPRATNGARPAAPQPFVPQATQQLSPQLQPLAPPVSAGGMPMAPEQPVV